MRSLRGATIYEARKRARERERKRRRGPRVRPSAAPLGSVCSAARVGEVRGKPRMAEGARPGSRRGPAGHRLARLIFCRRASSALSFSLFSCSICLATSKVRHVRARDVGKPPGGCSPPSSPPPRSSPHDFSWDERLEDSEGARARAKACCASVRMIQPWSRGQHRRGCVESRRAPIRWLSPGDIMTLRGWRGVGAISSTPARGRHDENSVRARALACVDRCLRNVFWARQEALALGRAAQSSPWLSIECGR